MYTIEVSSNDYVKTQAKGVYTLDLQSRFPELVNKQVIIRPNYWLYSGIELKPDGALTGVETEGYLIRSNIYNMKSFTSSGKSSNVLFPLSTSTHTYYSYSFEATLPSHLKFWLVKYDTTESAPIQVEDTDRLLISFNIIEK